MVQQHRIYVLQFDKGEPDQQELSCKVSPPKGAGRRIMYYYHDYGSSGAGGGGGKNGKTAKSRTLSLSGFFGLLLICFFGLVTLLLAAPGDFFSFARISGGAAAAAAATQQQRAPCSGVTGNDTLCCDRTSARADMCFARGDVRMHSASKSFQLVSSSAAATEQEPEEERIRPYTRKWEAHVMKTIDEVRFRRVSPGDAARCDVRHDMPAVLLSTGGFTGNVYHEFNDGLLPMFVTAGHLNRRVVFVILEYHDWWITKYGDVVSRLSAFPPIDFTADRRVHCFPEVIAGLRIHGELTVDPAQTPDGRSIRDFRRLLDDAYRPRIQYLERIERRAARKLRRSEKAAQADDRVSVDLPRDRERGGADGGGDGGGVRRARDPAGAEHGDVQDIPGAELERRDGGRARRRHDALPVHAAREGVRPGGAAGHGLGGERVLRRAGGPARAAVRGVQDPARGELAGAGVPGRGPRADRPRRRLAARVGGDQEGVPGPAERAAGPGQVQGAAGGVPPVPRRRRHRRRQEEAAAEK